MPLYQVETGLLAPDNKNCTFLWLYCMDGKPYAKYLPEGAPAHMPMVMTMLRWDGMFGTIGGKVDAGESLRQALAREVAEEGDFWLSEGAEVTPLGTFVDGGWHIHSFALEVSHDELVQARTRATMHQANSSECAGFCIVPTADYLPDVDVGVRGLSAFSRNAFCSTAKLEFDALLRLIAKRAQTSNLAQEA